MDSKSCNHSIEKEKICRRIMDVSVQFLLVFVITFAVTMISFAGFGKRTVKAAETENTYSTNVSIATDQSTYYCADGQKFKFDVTVTTEEVYDEGVHKYIGYLAVLDGGWQQIKAWFISGGIVQYTFTLDSSDYTKNGDTSRRFVVSVFPVDNFTQGASLCDQMFTVAFLPSSYSLTYNANGGQCDVTQGEMIYNCPYGTLPVPTRAGYTFDGWYTSAAGGTKITEDTVVTVKGNQTLYAHWIPNTYTIILDAGRGACSPLSVTGTYDSAYAALKNVTFSSIPEGYSFDGWYTSASGGTKVQETTTISIPADHTIYAHWKANSYQVAFQTNGGSCETIKKAVIYGETYGKLPLPEKEGYRFDGWYADSSVNSRKITEETLMTTPGDHILYARWTENETPSTEPETPSTGSGTSSGGADTPSTETPVKPPNSSDEKNVSVQINIFTGSKPALKAAIAGANKIKLSWQPVSGAEKYRIYYSKKNKNFKLLKTVSASAKSYTVGNLKKNTTYYYMVEGISEIGGKTFHTQKSSVVSKKAVGSLPKPVLKSQAPKGNTLILRWKKQKGAKRVVIYRKVGSGSYKLYKTVGGAKTSYKISLKKFDVTKKYSFCIKTYYVKDGVKIWSNASKPIRIKGK